MVGGRVTLPGETYGLVLSIVVGFVAPVEPIVLVSLLLFAESG